MKLFLVCAAALFLVGCSGSPNTVYEGDREVVYQMSGMFSFLEMLFPGLSSNPVYADLKAGVARLLSNFGDPETKKPYTHDNFVEADRRSQKEHGGSPIWGWIKLFAVGVLLPVGGAILKHYLGIQFPTTTGAPGKAADATYRGVEEVMTRAVIPTETPTVPVIEASLVKDILEKSHIAAGVDRFVDNRLDKLFPKPVPPPPPAPAAGGSA